MWILLLQFAQDYRKLVQYNQEQNMIFNWVSRCWGGMGINTRFQKARINCSIPDWTIPYQEDIITIITSFQDRNPEIPAKTAMDKFLSHLEADQQRSHPAFLLKHLYVLDHCVEQMTILDTIGYYYNSNLTSPKSFKNLESIDAHSSLKQLINHYYTYLKTKARNYAHYQTTYFCKQLKPSSQKFLFPITSSLNPVKIIDDKIFLSSMSLDGVNSSKQMLSSSKKKKKQCTEQQKSIFKLFQKQTSYNSIFDIIQKCQEIQKCILDMNKAYANKNKKVQLVKYIFIMCLKTYIRCYIIVSVGIRFLFKQFMTMNSKELEKFIRTFQYFNSEYTSDFIMFIQSNKEEIQIFKSINYTQLTFLNKENMRILLNYQQELRQKQLMKEKNFIGFANQSKTINFLANDQIQEQKIVQLPHQVQVIIKQNMKIFYKPRKNMDYCLETFSKKQLEDPITYNQNVSSQDMAEYFFKYQNNYHQNFNIPNEEGGNENSSSMSRSGHSNIIFKMTSSNIKERQKSQNKQQKQAKQIIDNLKLQMQLKQMKLHHGKSVQYDNIVNILPVKDQKEKNRKQNKTNSLVMKEKDMKQIREIFSMSKQGRTNEVWQQWENIYATNGIASKN